MLKTKLLGATAAAQALAIEDVFSTYLYTSNGSTQTITNGIDLAGEGGLVWIKSRSDAVNNVIVDTERVSGTTDNYLMTNITNPQVAHHNEFGSFTSTGFTIPYNTEAGYTNFGTRTYASWTFRKAPRFFDVVTYTGTGVNGRTVSHNLGVEPGMIVVKQTSGTEPWMVYHRSLGSLARLNLNTTNAAVTGNDEPWYGVDPTPTEFTVAYNSANASGQTYVAYLFAHDPLGPSGDGSDGLIACGSYTGNGSTTGPVIDLGFEPQWLLIKRASGGTGNWFLVDAMRGLPVGSNSSALFPNNSNAEDTNAAAIDIIPTGFQPKASSIYINASSSDYIYIAIRRGPMREPTSGTEVYTAGLNSSGSYTVSTGWPADFAIQRNRTATNFFSRPYARLTGTNYLETTSTAAESGGGTAGWANNTGYSNSTITSTVDWVFRRAPGFFDVVAYTGNGVAGRTVSHNLGVAPELMIAKPRDQVRGWPTYWLPLGPTFTTYLNSTGLPTSGPNMWNSTNPSDTNFTVGNDADINANGFKYIAYLFSTLAGISKVGSYTGNGSSQTIDCGFTSGARFILIKRTDDNDDWYVWDTARGIVAGNDPHLSLNTTAAEVTTNDSIDPDNSGFIVNQVAATNINVNVASYIYFAVS